MRNITLLLSFIFVSLGYSQTKSPFLRNLGVGINQNIECFCTDSKGDLTVGYYPPNNENTLIFEKWDAVNKRWIPIAKLGSSFRKTKSSKCVYTSNDSLVVFTYFNSGGITNIAGLFYVSNTKISELSRFGSSTMKGADVFMADMKIIKGKLVVFGNFDTILNWNKKLYQFSNIASYNSEEWEKSEISSNLKTFNLANIPVANNNDTTLIVFDIPDYDLIVRYIYPSKWETIRKAPRKELPISSVTYLGNKWLFTRTNSDSVTYFDGRNFTRKKTGISLGSQLSIINTPKSVLITEDKKISRIYRLDTTSNKLFLLYQAIPPIEGDSAISSLLKSKETIYYRSNVSIIFKDKKLGKIAELNLDSARVFKYNSITAYIFYDKNKNYKLDNGEDLIPSIIRNRTYGNFINAPQGTFEEKIPDFIDAEYELVKYTYAECLKLPFTGALKTNTLNGSINGSLYFPLQKNSSTKNIYVKSWGKATARLLDTIPLSVKVTNVDCNLKNSDATVIILLDSNTQLVNSSPNYSLQSGNKLIYNLTNINTINGALINLKVIYSNSKYKINEYVKHLVTITSTYPEDSTDNKDSIVQKMVYSYDPNAKYSIPQGKIISDLNHIRYYIQFQNEGNAEARRVMIIDTLDTRIPVYEFQMVASSHAYSVSLRNNVVTWIFDNINLPPKSLDDKGSQGYVIFDAKIISNIGVGDSIKNKAFIYFDYNEPIVTNLSIIKRIEDLPQIDETDYTFRVFPNPATSTVTIENKINVFQNVKVYNMLGQEVVDLQLDPIGKTIQSISQWPRGMYFIRSTKGNFQKFLVH
jgi:hypothetical protein